MTDRFDGRVAVVTGAGSGIGRASALAFARAGARVVVADVDADGGRETVQMIEAQGGTATVVRADVAQAAEVEALMAAALQTYGRLDYAHNNAGIEGIEVTTVDCPEENWDRLIAVNLKSVWLCMKYEIPQMLRQRYGAIVNTSSISGLVGFGISSAYVASKHGITGLTKKAALEYAQTGIRINAVCPGVIHTPMIDRFTRGDPLAMAKMMEGEPIGRMGMPEEVAAAVVWLCSDAASFVIGHTLMVDGGFVAQ